MHILGHHLLEALARHQVHHGAGHGRHHAIVFRDHHEGREGLDGQLGVVRWAGGDEGRGDGVDLVEVEGVVEGLGIGDLALGCAEVGAVTGFDAEDAASFGEIGGVHDFGSGSEVSANTNTCRQTVQLVIRDK